MFFYRYPTVMIGRNQERTCLCWVAALPAQAALKRMHLLLKEPGSGGGPPGPMAAYWYPHPVLIGIDWYPLCNNGVPKIDRHAIIN